MAHLSNPQSSKRMWAIITLCVSCDTFLACWLVDNELAITLAIDKFTKIKRSQAFLVVMVEPYWFSDWIKASHLNRPSRIMLFPQRNPDSSKSIISLCSKIRISRNVIACEGYFSFTPALDRLTWLQTCPTQSMTTTLVQWRRAKSKTLVQGMVPNYRIRGDVQE